MKLKNILLLWSISFLSVVCFSQNVQQTLQKADSLSAIQEYKNAEILYDRVLFFADSTVFMDAYQKTALCKIALNKYSEAADLYKLASNITASDTLYFSILHKQALCLTMDKQYEDAQKILNEIRLVEAPKYFIKKAFLLNGIIETNYLNFEKAKLDFDSCQGLLTIIDSILVQNLLNQNIKATNISSNRAGIYSAIIPGLGQTVHGNFKNGINSFILNAGFLTAFIYTGNQYNYVSSFLFYSFFFPRFYLGGISASKNIATQKLEDEKKKFLSSYLKIYLKY